MTSTLGPVELWALNTTADDVQVRNQLYKRVGGKVARQLLAQHFPSGSAVKMMENMLAEYKSDGAYIDDEVRSSMSQKIVDDIIVSYRESQAAQ